MYDAENHIMGVAETSAAGGGSETLAYDGFGRRVQKRVPSGITVYVYDAFGQLAAEYSTAAAPPSSCGTC